MNVLFLQFVDVVLLTSWRAVLRVFILPAVGRAADVVKPRPCMERSDIWKSRQLL